MHPDMFACRSVLLEWAVLSAKLSANSRVLANSKSVQCERLATQLLNVLQLSA